MSDLIARASMRAAELGKLGEVLLGLVMKATNWQKITHLHTRRLYDGIAGDFEFVNRIEGACGKEVAAAASMLMSEYPIQVDLSMETLVKLVLRSFPRYGKYQDLWARVAGGDGQRLRHRVRLVDSKEFRKTYIPLKTCHPGAENKVNVFFSEIWSAVKRVAPRLALEFASLSSEWAGKIYDDQASAILLYAAGIKDVVVHPVCFALAALFDADAAKSVNIFIKAMGLNSTEVGCRLVELTTLRGRDTAGSKLEEEASYRVDFNKVRKGLCEFDESELREAIRDIYSEELLGRPEFEDRGVWWSRRWEWCVNGAHSRFLEEHWQGCKVERLPGITRWYRRMFAENMKEDPLEEWDGTTFVSAAEKLEHGKVRAIFSCDTLNYFAFEHLMKPVETRWRGKRVVLSPGNDGHCGMVRRIKTQSSGGGVNVMLDYDDFNSAHSTRAMQVVVEELISFCDYDEKLGAKLVASFEREHMVVAGKDIGLVAGTLMSGHRMTTFINSVLNAAYIRCALGRETYLRCNSLHVGDDVYMCVKDLDDVTRVVRRLRESGCRMNPMKQSIGTLGSEFLRVATRGYESFGYLARSVGACVSGNWVTEFKLDAREALNTMITHCVTLNNRCLRRFDYAAVLAESVCRSAGIKRRNEKLVQALLRGEVAVDGGPCYSKLGVHKSVKLKLHVNEEYRTKLESLPAYGVRDYLREGLRDIERRGLELSRFDPAEVMKDSSYRKGLMYRASEEELAVSSVAFTGLVVSEAIGSERLENAMNMEYEKGVLTKFPLLNFLKGHLKQVHVVELLNDLGVTAPSNKTELYNLAWGVNSQGVVIESALSYTDARTLGRRCGGKVIYSPHDYWV